MKSSLFIAVAAVSLNLFAENNSINSNCVDFLIKPGKDANHIVLENKTSEKYDKFTWILGDGRIKEANSKSVTYYFPFKGDYEVSLIGESEGLKCVRTQKVSIKTDDYGYNDKLELSWSDEFDGSVINADNWTFETGATGWGNNELQNYTDGENASIRDGKLIITAKRITDREKVRKGDFTSTRMITKDKQEFLYGRVEMKAKMPAGKGLWAAFWMLGANFPDTMWPYCGEIDIMEYVGYDKDVQNVAMHNGSSYANTRYKKKVTLENMETEFHIYGIIWDKYSVKFYIDDVNNVIYTYKPEEYNSSTWPYGKPHFILLNLAVGGNWGGKKGIDLDIFPAEYIVDYVRVYQHPEYR